MAQATANSGDGGSVKASPAHITKDNIMTFSYYQLFGLPDPVLDSGAGSVVIEPATLTRAYRRFSLLFHPDKDDSPAAREAFERVKAALDTLTDATKRAEYDDSRRTRAAGPSGLTGDGTRGDAAAQRRQQQAAEDADFAEQVLRQKEASQAAAAAAEAKAAAEREEAMRRMREELTGALDTPFKLMEGEVVREWDVDEDLLAMKMSDVAKLMAELGVAVGGGAGDDAARKKRHRAEGV